MLQVFADIMLRSAEIQARYGAQVDVAAIKGEVDRQRAEMQQMFTLQADRERMAAEMQAQLQAQMQPMQPDFSQPMPQMPQMPGQF